MTRSRGEYYSPDPVIEEYGEDIDRFLEQTHIGVARARGIRDLDVLEAYLNRIQYTTVDKEVVAALNQRKRELEDQVE